MVMEVKEIVFENLVMKHAKGYFLEMVLFLINYVIEFIGITILNLI